MLFRSNPADDFRNVADVAIKNKNDSDIVADQTFFQTFVIFNRRDDRVGGDSIKKCGVQSNSKLLPFLERQNSKQVMKPFENKNTKKEQPENRPK